MHDSILFKNLSILTSDGLREGDLLVEQGKIKALDWKLPQSADLIIQDSGLTMLPGIIDTHVHFREPGHTHKEDLFTGSKAAVSGGVTSFCDMPNTSPATVTVELLEEKKAMAKEKSLANYNFYIAATSSNIPELNKAKNIPGIKIFVGSSTGDLLVDDPRDIEAIFANTSALIAVHSEDEATIIANKAKYEGSTDPSDHSRIRSPEAALKSTKFLVELAEKYQRRLHILHLTTKEELDFLIQRQPKYVSTELCIQHALLHAPDCYERLGTYAQINPPLREATHAAALWKGLKSGHIPMLVTDHAPHSKEEKDKGFGNAPSGMPGIETSLQLALNQVHEGRCSLEDIAKWMSKGPATTYGIKNKGEIKLGMDADLVLVDLNADYEIGKQYSKCGWSAFEGYTGKGKAISTIVNGQLVYREGDFFEESKGQEIQFHS